MLFATYSKAQKFFILCVGHLWPVKNVLKDFSLAKSSKDFSLAKSSKSLKVLMMFALKIIQIVEDIDTCCLILSYCSVSIGSRWIEIVWPILKWASTLMV